MTPSTWARMGLPTNQCLSASGRGRKGNVRMMVDPCRSVGSVGFSPLRKLDVVGICWPHSRCTAEISTFCGQNAIQRRAMFFLEAIQACFNLPYSTSLMRCRILDIVGRRFFYLSFARQHSDKHSHGVIFNLELRLRFCHSYERCQTSW